MKSVERCNGEAKTKITSDNFDLISSRWKVNMNEIVIFCKIIGLIGLCFFFQCEA